MTLFDVIHEVADGFGNVEPGNNGPWQIQQTPVRNSAHWLILFSWVYSATKKRKYLDTVARLAEYLASKEARPNGYAFYNLKGYIANPANGLIGQAWVIEALAEATRVLEDEKYAAIGEQVFFQHTFSEKHGLWHSLEVDGQILPLNPTLNQQVWFAATAARLPSQHSSDITIRVLQFMDRLEDHLHVLGDGLLGMHVKSLPPTARGFPKRAAQIAMKRWPGRMEDLRHLLAISPSERQGSPAFTYLDRSVGYHSFTLYGLALLKEAIPSHPFWKSRLLYRALQWTLSGEYKRKLEGSNFAFGYNPTGFEVSYVLTTFFPCDMVKLVEEGKWWVIEQVKRCYNSNTGRLDRNSVDPATLTARIYEATRLPDCLLETCLNDVTE